MPFVLYGAWVSGLTARIPISYLLGWQILWKEGVMPIEVLAGLSFAGLVLMWVVLPSRLQRERDED